MAIREGRCANCGSIIKVDDNREEAVCMFCWAHTPAAQSLAIASKPDDYTFANETQAEPDEESRRLAFVGSAGASRQSHGGAKVSKPQPKKQKPGKISPAEKVASMKKELVDPRLEAKVKRALFGGITGLVILILAVALPLALDRDKHRKTLEERVPASYSGLALRPGSYAFEGQKNRSLTLVLDRKIDEPTLKDLHARYKKLRAEVYAQPENEQQVTLRVYGENGLFSINGRGEIQQKSQN